MDSCSSKTIIKDCSKKTAVCKIISTTFISHKKPLKVFPDVYIHIFIGNAFDSNTKNNNSKLSVTSIHWLN